MYRTRGERRHFDRKHKEKARNYFKNVVHWDDGFLRCDDRVIGMRARTRVPCSCWMCGNQRMGKNGHWNKTRKELLSDIELQEELELLDNNHYYMDYYDCYDEFDYMGYFDYVDPYYDRDIDEITFQKEYLGNWFYEEEPEPYRPDVVENSRMYDFPKGFWD